MKRIATYAIALMMTSSFIGCTTGRYFKKVRLVSFDENVGNGKSVGKLTGESCIWRLFNSLDLGKADLSNAFDNARTNTSGLDSAFGKKTSEPVRYMTDVRSDFESTNYILVAKYCYVITGMGYK